MFNFKFADFYCNLRFKLLKNTAILPIQQHLGDGFPSRVVCDVLLLDAFVLFLVPEILHLLLLCHTLFGPTGTLLL